MGVAMAVETIGPGTCPECGGPASIGKDHNGKVVRVSCLNCSHNAQRQPKGQGDAKRKPAVSEHLAELFDLTLATGDAELFHTPSGDPFATVPVGDHHETYGLETKAFKRWLAGRFHATYGVPPPSQAVKDIVDALAGRALFDGPEQQVHTRLAEHQGRIYLDLADASWGVIEVTQTGWRRVQKPPVKFRRPKGMLRLPEPVRGGTLDELRSFLNVGGDADWILVLAWLVAALRPRGPYPVLVFQAEQGSGKSTTARFLRSLVDPNAAALRSEPREARDLMIAATNSWCIVLDNLSKLTPWLGDGLCRLATGGGFTTRQLWTDGEEVIFDAERPVLLNGITEVVARPDLLERSVIVTLPHIPEDRRRAEAELERRFEAARSRILGALLTAVSTALRRLPDTRLERSPRMSDFAHWVVAAEGALGFEDGAFLKAYAGNRAEANQMALEGAPIVPALLALAGEGAWLGTAAQLLEALEMKAGIEALGRRPEGWPKSARALSGTLRRIAPNLRAIGVEVAFGVRVDRDNARGIRPQKAGAPPSARSAPSASPGNVSDDAVFDAHGPRTVENSADGAPHRPPATVRGETQAPSTYTTPADAADAADGRMQPYANGVCESVAATCTRGDRRGVDCRDRCFWGAK